MVELVFDYICPVSNPLLVTHYFRSVSNWGVYIWAVDQNQLFEASLGYYINPLLNVFLGFVFLRERLTRLQWLAVTLAAMGVTIQIVTLGHIPWIALILACSFIFSLSALRQHKKLSAAIG